MPAYQQIDQLSGTKIGNLEIIRLLGEGGMGVTYLGKEHDLNRDVCVKFLRADHIASEAFLRFKREAIALANLTDKNVVSVYSFGLYNEVYPYIVMELCQGSSLDRLLAENVDWRTTCNLMIQVCRAVQRIHNAGIVHRDIKPENILYDSNRSIKIVDFGLCALDSTDGKTTITGTGTTVGSPFYMAPECFTAISRSPSVDIYALGIVLFELLSGRPPFSDVSTIPVLAFKRVTEDFPELPATVAPLEQRKLLHSLVSKACAPRAEDRFQSAEEMANCLSLILQEDTNRDTLHCLLQSAPREKPRKRHSPLLLFSALTLIACAALLMARSAKHPAEDTDLKMLCSSLMAARPFFPSGGPLITILEKRIIGTTYQGEAQRRRLDRLEATVFGKPSSERDPTTRTDILVQHEEQKDLESGTSVAYKWLAEISQEVCPKNYSSIQLATEQYKHASAQIGTQIVNKILSDKSVSLANANLLSKCTKKLARANATAQAELLNLAVAEHLENRPGSERYLAECAHLAVDNVRKPSDFARISAVIDRIPVSQQLILDAQLTMLAARYQIPQTQSLLERFLELARNASIDRLLACKSYVQQIGKDLPTAESTPRFLEVQIRIHKEERNYGQLAVEYRRLSDFSDHDSQDRFLAQSLEYFELENLKDPESITTLDRLANKADGLSEALSYFQRAKRRIAGTSVPPHIRRDYLFTAANMAFRSGSLDEAIRFQSRALDEPAHHDDTYIESRRFLAELLAETGQNERYLQQLKLLEQLWYDNQGPDLSKVWLIKSALAYASALCRGENLDEACKVIQQTKNNSRFISLPEKERLCFQITSEELLVNRCTQLLSLSTGKSSTLRLIKVARGLIAAQEKNTLTFEIASLTDVLADRMAFFGERTLALRYLDDLSGNLGDLKPEFRAQILSDIARQYEKLNQHEKALSLFSQLGSLDCFTCKSLIHAERVSTSPSIVVQPPADFVYTGQLRAEAMVFCNRKEEALKLYQTIWGLVDEPDVTPAMYGLIAEEFHALLVTVGDFARANKVRLQVLHSSKLHKLPAKQRAYFTRQSRK